MGKKGKQSCLTFMELRHFLRLGDHIEQELAGVTLYLG